MSSKSKKKNLKKNKNKQPVKAKKKQAKKTQKSQKNKSTKQKQKNDIKKAPKKAKNKTKQSKTVSKSVKKKDNKPKSNKSQSLKKPKPSKKPKQSKKPQQSKKKKCNAKKQSTKPQNKKKKQPKSTNIKKKPTKPAKKEPKKSAKPKASKQSKNKKQESNQSKPSKPSKQKKKQTINNTKKKQKNVKWKESKEVSAKKSKQKSSANMQPKKKVKTESIKQKSKAKEANKLSKKVKSNTNKKQSSNKSVKVKAGQAKKFENNCQSKNIGNINKKKNVGTGKHQLSKKVSKKVKQNNAKVTKDRKQKEVPKSDQNIWDDYIGRFGTEAHNASQLQQFSKTNVNYQTLPYSEANMIFKKYSNKKEEKIETKQDRKQVYIKRDIYTAKKRLSQRLNQKEMNIMLFNAQVHIEKDNETDEEEKEEDNESDDESKEVTPTSVTSTSVSDNNLYGNDNENDSDNEESETKENEDEINEISEEELTHSDEENEDNYESDSQSEVDNNSEEVINEFEHIEDEMEEKKESSVPPPLPKRKAPAITLRQRNQKADVVSDDRIDKYEGNKVGSMEQVEKFLESERVYVKSGLRIGYETFLNRLNIQNKLNESILSDDDIQTVFGNYESLYNINSKLFEDLMDLRLNGGIGGLRDNLGKVMVNFIPYFRMYAEYIVKKQSAIVRLDELKKTNKKFKQFLKINEVCVKRKLKSFLEEPVYRILQYLERLGQIYALYKKENKSHNSGQQLLLQSIVDIKNVLDEIAIKCRDLKARSLVGTLQRDFFASKINLLSAHRFCITHMSMDMLLYSYKEKKIKTYKFILCNDILLISTLPTKFKSANLIYVYPLIGLRVSRNPVPNSDNRELLQSREYKLRILPSSNILFCENEQQMERLIEIIEEAVDEQEHSLKQCNVVDLEKRVRKQKTSKEGKSDTITITNPERVRQIELWRKEKYKIDEDLSVQETEMKKPPSYPPSKIRSVSNPQNRPALPKRKAYDVAAQVKENKMQNNASGKPPPLPKRKSYDAAESIKNNSNVPPLPKKKPVDSVRKIQQNKTAPPLPNRNVTTVKKTLSPEPPPPPKPRSQTVDVSIIESKNEIDSVVKDGKMRTNLLSGITSFKTGELKHIDSETSNKSMATKNNNNSMRMNLLSGISSFKTGQLKHIDAETLKKKATSEPDSVTNLLQATLKTYRQFVMDDDEENDSDSDGDWSD